MKAYITILIIFLTGCLGNMSFNTLEYNSKILNPDTLKHNQEILDFIEFDVLVTNGQIDCSDQKMKNYLDECYYVLAAKENDAQYCDKIEKENIKDACFKRMSAHLNNTGFCENISNETLKDDCYGQFVIVEPNLDLCKKLGYPHSCLDAIYNKHILGINFSKNCNNDSIESVKRLCEDIQNLDDAFLSNNVTLCNDSSRVDKCYSRFLYNLSRRSNDPSVCSLHIDDSSMTYCYIHFAIKNEKPDICNILSGDNYDDCIVQIVKHFKDVELCEGIESYNLCVHYVAEKTLDYSICDRSTNDRSRGLCIVNVAELQNETDKSWCGSIEYERSLAECYEIVAVNSEDEKICGKIKNPAEYNQCIKGVALRTLNPELCRMVKKTHPTSQNYANCIKTYAAKTKNMSVCVNLEEPAFSECLYDYDLHNPFICRVLKDTTKEYCIKALGRD
ncbi:hypothetical protein K9M79_04760 [Candidatus Woesearchaeota archaeon]|nr:hypothetical protein [Candidatus Woesearchaeota archaeon]